MDLTDRTISLMAQGSPSLWTMLQVQGQDFREAFQELARDEEGPDRLDPDSQEAAESAVLDQRRRERAARAWNRLDPEKKALLKTILNQTCRQMQILEDFPDRLLDQLREELPL